MARNKKLLPQFESVNELAEFFDTHDLGEYWDEFPEAHFDIEITKRTHIVAIDADLTEKLAAIARRKHIPSQALVNTWLREKLSAQ